ncbi:Fe/S biogenesis protein NfuA [Pseudohongiella acticola]|jgi:Fe/S biogenesis protein NfuA|uniref:Fe/S biogenesis protein NfuA n=1 Tax=Pseudohongiella acticola TaxID=1524254 RepID=A0A1E8CHW1_9GAMM|nr:Fe-S biogenesis protein NfuA [Pseudohongiella acticola]OFE11847.1 Fe/S biogenesis protein NfuA [Pseudohongiella acticola]
MVTITEPAQEYLAELLKKQDCEGIGIRVFILDPGTPKAETCISFCRPGEEKEEDEQKAYEHFDAWVEKRSIPFLEDAVVDYAKDSMGGQLTIKAPNSRLPKIRDDSPLEDRINYVLYNEINPSLASHGGVVSLEEIVDDSIAVLKFGGGCQGCGMVDVTLKEGVEKTLVENVPGLTGVRDVTDHSNRENAYFQ